MERRLATLGVAFAFWVLCACPPAMAQFGLTLENTTMRVHAYEGAPRPASQIATVFAPYGMNGEMTHICNVDGKSYRKLGWTSSCPSVVYLLPGTHQLKLDFYVARLVGSPTVPIQVEAGKSYMVRGVLSGDRRATFSIDPMPQGFVLTYKDIYPASFSKSGVKNTRVDPADAR